MKNKNFIIGTVQKIPKKIKTPKVYKKVEANLLRTLFNRERQLLQAQRLTRELWNLLRKVKPSK